MAELKVNLIGPGRVGQTMLGLLRDVPECSVQDVLGSRPESAKQAVKAVGAGRAAETYADLRPADLWVLTVPDSQISAVAGEVAKVFKDRDARAPTAFHCSGYFAADQMAPLVDLGWHLASVHPVLTFTDAASAIRQFNGTYCGVEGDRPALDLIEPLLEKLGAHPFEIKSENKSLYHAAAVISNNFTVVLQAIAREAWSAAGVPDEIAQDLNATLLRATYENVTAHGPAEALTGPAARGDEAVVTAQGKDVARWHPAAGVLYEQLSTLARNVKTRGTTRSNHGSDT